MLYDSVQLFAVALTGLSRARDVRTSSLSCAKPRPWSHGSSLSNYVRTVFIIRILSISTVDDIKVIFSCFVLAGRSRGKLEISFLDRKKYFRNQQLLIFFSPLDINTE